MITKFGNFLKNLKIFEIFKIILKLFFEIILIFNLTGLFMTKEEISSEGESPCEGQEGPTEPAGTLRGDNNNYDDNNNNKIMKEPEAGNPQRGVDPPGLESINSIKCPVTSIAPIRGMEKGPQGETSVCPRQDEKKEDSAAVASVVNDHAKKTAAKKTSMLKAPSVPMTTEQAVASKCARDRQTDRDLEKYFESLARQELGDEAIVAMFSSKKKSKSKVRTRSQTKGQGMERSSNSSESSNESKSRHDQSGNDSVITTTLITTTVTDSNVEQTVTTPSGPPKLEGPSTTNWDGLQDMLNNLMEPKGSRMPNRLQRQKQGKGKCESNLNALRSK